MENRHFCQPPGMSLAGAMVKNIYVRIVKKKQKCQNGSRWCRWSADKIWERKRNW
jgi:hypothetical protein